MSKIEKLKKLSVDIDYIDPTTMKKVCSFNQCIDKFTLTGTDEITTFPKWANGKPLVKTTHFHICNECGRKHRSQNDKRKNVDSFYEAVAGAGNPLNKQEHA